MVDFSPFQELEKLLGHANPTPPVQFPPNSRYRATPIVPVELPDGRLVVCLKRRFVPLPERFATQSEYTVHEGDRLDNLSFRFLGDPELFWMLCDANRALMPEELEEDGRTLRVPYPEGIPAPKNFA